MLNNDNPYFKTTLNILHESSYLKRGKNEIHKNQKKHLFHPLTLVEIRIVLGHLRFV